MTDSTTDSEPTLSALIHEAGLATQVAESGRSVLLPRGTALWRRLRQAMDEMALVAGYEEYVFPDIVDGETNVDGDAAVFQPFSPSSLNVVHATAKGGLARASLWREALHSSVDPSVLAQHHAYTLRKKAGEAEEDAYTLLDLQRRYFAEILAIPALAGALPADQRHERSTAYGLDVITPTGFSLRLAECGVLSNPSAYAVQHAALTPHLIPAILLTHLREGKPVFPPRLAPEQAVIIPRIPSKRRLELSKLAHQIRSGLRNKIRVALDESPSSSVEQKQELWASRGAPIQVLIGDEDLDHRQVELIRRDTGEREVISVNFLTDRVNLMLTEIQEGMLERAFEAREGMLIEPNSVDDLAGKLDDAPGYALAAWDGDAASALRIHEATGCAVTLLPFGAEAEAIGRSCLGSGNEARYAAIFARQHPVF